MFGHFCGNSNVLLVLMGCSLLSVLVLDDLCFNFQLEDLRYIDDVLPLCFVLSLNYDCSLNELHLAMNVYKRQSGSS